MSGKSRLDPRKFMELAVEVMRQSVSEPRKDGKASPKVGAVLVKPDGTVETACRGELRYRDHAELMHLGWEDQDNKLRGCYKEAHVRQRKDECPPDALFAHCVVQKALEADNDVRGKGVW